MGRGLTRLLLVAGALVALAVLFGGRLLSLYVDYLWFGSLGFEGPFLTVIGARVALFLAGAALFLAFYLPNVLLARRASRGIAGGSQIRILEPTASGPRPFAELADFMGGPSGARRAVAGLGVPLLVLTGFALAILMGLVATGQWEAVLRAWHAQPFGVNDPVFGRDVGFYVFTLPVLRFWQGWLEWAVLLTLAACVCIYGLALYALNPDLASLRHQLLNRGRPARTHLLLLGAVALFLIAAGTWLGAFDFLVAPHGRTTGANYTDLHARLPTTYALAASIALMGLLVVVSVWRQSYLLPLGGGVLVVVMLILGRGALPALVQRLQVDPAEITQERPYITENIRATRRAYDLDRISEQPFPAEEAVTPAEARENTATLANIRLWDYRPLLDTYNQLQSIRPYYAFGDVDVDRYTLDGEYRQVMLSARELVPDRLAALAQTWVNRRLQYTHGYGVVMSPVNQVAREGQPVFFLQDVPPTGRVPIERPEIYHGEAPAGYIVVNAGVQEFDYPSGDQNVFAAYSGTGGVALGPIWRRAALAWYLGDFNLLISTYLNQDSRLLIRRQVADRVRRLAPYLKLDRDPYLVVHDGRLVWVVDAYTTSDRYPYSQAVQDSRTVATPLPGTEGRNEGGGVSRRLTFNYIRNSVKVVIGAYDGAVTFYVSDPQDPLIRTYATIFPQMYRPLETMPPALRAHLRYPEDLFRVQAQVLRSYHVQDAQVFYNGEDVWSTPFESVAGERAPVEPYYVIMRLPGETREEFLLMLPFTPASRDNMISWLAARCDGDRYGELVLYKFPKDRLVYGPAQIDARIDQEPTISSQLTLWNQQGSRVVRGNLLVIPIGGSTLYVEPIYLQSENSRLPELRRVVVATGNRLAMEPTLEEGLARLFGPAFGPAGAPTLPAEAPGGAPAPGLPPGSPGSAETAAAAREARAAYQRAQEALRAGDFGRFGEELRQLDERLRQLERTTETPASVND